MAFAWRGRKRVSIKIPGRFLVCRHTQPPCPVHILPTDQPLREPPNSHELLLANIPYPTSHEGLEAKSPPVSQKGGELERGELGHSSILHADMWLRYYMQVRVSCVWEILHVQHVGKTQLFSPLHIFCTGKHKSGGEISACVPLILLLLQLPLSFFACAKKGSKLG